MLPPFIIEQIRQREQQERTRREEQQPRLELPIIDRAPLRRPAAEQPEEQDDVNRGIVILDLG